MGRRFRFSHSSYRIALVCFGILVGWAAFPKGAHVPAGPGTSQAFLRQPAGFPQLVSIEPWAEAEGAICEWMPASASSELRAALRQGQAARPTLREGADEGGQRPEDADREPVRVIRDTYPTYSAVAVDTNSNEAYLQDENLFGYKVFNRMDHTPPTASFTEPKRMVGGIETKLEFNCALYVDPKTGDVYSVNNDTVDAMVVFPRDAKGNVRPKRELRTPHGTFGIAVDEENQELFLTVQHDSAVVVYRKTAEGKEAPLRLLQGKRTLLADPHGIAVDTKNNWVFVSNHGSVYTAGGERGSLPANWPMGRDTAEIPGSGRFLPPSITTYPLKASGDTPPLRVIQGPKTLLNWPATLFVDQERGELYVANDAADSILVFRTTDSGDVTPSRVIQGSRTGIKYPTGIFVDQKNDEIWVSNMGNHSATVYRRDAAGNAPPLRTIRSAPAGKLALAIGNPGAVAYDSKREEILVPN